MRRNERRRLVERKWERSLIERPFAIKRRSLFRMLRGTMSHNPNIPRVISSKLNVDVMRGQVLRERRDI
jgi:hypothetical protein